MKTKHEILLYRQVFFLIAIFFCGFDLYFLATGYDEIWNGYNMNWYLVGVAVVLMSLGLFSLYIAVRWFEVK